MIYPKHCPECGNDVVLTAQDGRTMPYKDMSALALPSNLEIPTCVNCGEEFFDESLTNTVDKILSELHQKESNGR